jgi:hypothetical protein
VRLTNQKSTCSGNVDQLKLVNRDMRALGCLEIINLENTIFQATNDKFHVEVAKTPEEINGLLEVGFEYVCEKDGLMFFRKRK